MAFLIPDFPFKSWLAIGVGGIIGIIRFVAKQQKIGKPQYKTKNTILKSNRLSGNAWGLFILRYVTKHLILQCNKIHKMLHSFI